MHRDAKICWTGFALTSVTVAAVVTATILFTVFPKDYDASVLNFDPSQVARNAQNEKVDRFDHRAHSVPGGEYVATDFAGKGAVAVTLDGSRSHTHYVEEGPPLVTGFIQNFVWFDNATHIVLGTGVKPTIDFDVGVTEIGLTVADNTRDTQTDFTRVVIKSPIASGVYCYFYTEAPSASLVQGAKPVYAMESDKIDFATAADFPTRPWTHARCVFRALVRPGTKFTFSHAGAIQLTVKDTTVIATGSTGTYTGASTTAECQVIYTRTGGGKLQMTAGPSGLTYDLSKTLPILLKIDPTSSTFEGGGTARIDGLSLGNNLEVYFGSTKAEIDTEQVDNEGKYVYVVVPEFAAGASATVYAQSETRRSNTLGFRYSADGRAPVKFTKAVIKEGNRDFFRGQITGIKYGPDHRYHVVTHGGTVHSFEVNREMIVVPNSVCNHPALGKNRKALGLAFDYSSKAIKLYVSTSVLEWKSKGYLVSGFAWANGQIHLLQKDGASRCLKAAPRPIITGLPVSNYDHGIK